MQNIIDRLGLQSDAFQESFNILSQAKNLEELAKKFFHVLRGNLLVVNAVIYFKRNEKANWKILFSKAKNPDIQFSDVLSKSEFRIAHIEHSEFELSINHALIDKAVFRILLGAKLDKSPYTGFDKIALQFFLQQLDNQA